MEEKNVDRLLNSLRRNGVWVLLISITGVLFIGLMTWIHVFNDAYFFRRDFAVRVILIGLILVGLLRYVLFVRQQAVLSKKNGLNDQQRIDRYYKRSFYFWLTEAVLTVGAAALFGYLVYSGI